MIKTLNKNQKNFDSSDVIRGLRKGQQWAQVAFYDMYFTPAYHTSYRILRNRMDAEDAVHEGFIKAFHKIDSLKDAGAAEGWLKRIVVNETLNHLKINQRFTILDENQNESFEEEEVKVALPSLEELNSCINELPDGYRVICQLYFIEELKHEEIAKYLGVSASTSRSQLSRAKIKLQELIKNRKKLA